MNYPIQHFITYSYLVADEMYRRGYKVYKSRFENHGLKLRNIITNKNNLFKGWHNERYFIQCYFNLQEKYDCDGITEEEWVRIEHLYREEIMNKLCSGQGGI